MNIKIIIIIVCVLVTVGVFFALTFPALIDVQKNIIQIANKEAEIIRAEDIIAKTKEYNEIKEEAEKIFAALPTEIDTAELMSLFSRKAANNGVVLLVFTPSSIVQTKEGAIGEDLTYPYLTANLQVTGAYADIQRFLMALEANIRAMDVETINFSAGTRGDANELLNVSIGIKVYYQ